jgi:hypothetical protein
MKESNIQKIINEIGTLSNKILTYEPIDESEDEFPDPIAKIYEIIKQH